MGGEIKRATRSQILGIFAALAVATVLLVAVALLSDRVFGTDFQGAIAFNTLSGVSPATSITPWFTLLASLLANNPVITIIIAGTMCLWPFFWVPLELAYVDRSMLAWSLDRMAPEKLGYVSDRYHTPVVAIVVCMIVAIAFLALYAFTPWFGTLSLIEALSIIWGACMLVGALMPYLKRDVWAKSPAAKYQIAGVPLITISGLLGTAAFAYVIYLLWNDTVAAGHTNLSVGVQLDGESGVRAFEKTVSDAGYYPFRTTVEQLNHEGAAGKDHVFKEQVIRRLQMWDELATGHLPIYVAPGNDDDMYVDDVLAQSRNFINAEAVEVELPGGDRLYSTGWTNRTPWHTPRELDEPELLERLERILAGMTDPHKAIFNFHVPPKDSGLDTCFEVNERLEVVSELGQPKLTSAGSSAVRDILTRLQPAASLHGHIHESRGMSRIGRTVAFNPGSEYTEGILRGVLLSLKGDQIERHQFTSG